MKDKQALRGPRQAEAQDRLLDYRLVLREIQIS